MARQRKNSNLSMDDDLVTTEQELGSMYDYLAKIILLGPSGSGKSCLLHRFVKNEWRFVSSQTIGVEFASKIVKIGTGARRKRVKLQLWDTAGTERFRSVSRSYYRGAAGALLVYDVASHNSFTALPTFLHDARALASPQLTLLLAGNKADLADGTLPQPATSTASTSLPDTASIASSIRPSTAQSSSTIVDAQSSTDGGGGVGSGARGGADSSNNSIRAPSVIGLGTRNTATVAFDGREVTAHEAAAWAASQNIAVSVEVSALSGDGVDELFARLARMILTKIELGEIDPDDPQSGIQYGDGGRWAGGASDAGSIKSQSTVRRRKGRGRAGTNGWMTGMREWEEVFRLDGGPGRRRRCC